MQPPPGKPNKSTPRIEMMACAGRVPRMFRWLLLCALGLGGSPAVFAAPCAGFDDVEDTSEFCTNVEWVRNRGVTLGCFPALYCPDANVTRLQMAAFMNRLGTALRPVFLTHSQLVSAFPGSGETVICQVTNTPADFPRLASPASVSVHLTALGAAAAFAGLVVSIDNGVTWTAWSTRLSVYPTNAAGVDSTLSPAAPPFALAAGQTVKFGVQPFKGSGGPDFDEAQCELNVRIENAG